MKTFCVVLQEVDKAPKKKGLKLPFDKVTLTFSNLHYFVPNPKGSGELELLKGIYGVFRPGVLTALMGASGAGSALLVVVVYWHSCLSERSFD